MVVYVFMFLNVKIVPVSLTECFEPPVTTSELLPLPSLQGSETETHVFKPLDISFKTPSHRFESYLP